MALVQPQDHEAGGDVDEAQELEGPLGAEGGNEGEAGGGGAGDGAETVDRVGVADAAAEAPEAGGVDATHHREEGAHEQGGDEHDGEGDGEDAQAVAPPGAGPLDPAAPLRPPGEEEDRAETHQADEDLHRAEEGGQVPLRPQVAAAGEAAQGDPQEEGDEDDAELVVGVDSEGDDEEAQPGDLVPEGGEAGEAESGDDGGDDVARDRFGGRRRVRGHPLFQRRCGRGYLRRPGGVEAGVGRWVRCGGRRGSDLGVSGRFEADAGTPIRRRGRGPPVDQQGEGGDGEVDGRHHPGAALQPEGLHQEEGDQDDAGHGAQGVDPVEQAPPPGRRPPAGARRTSTAPAGWRP